MANLEKHLIYYLRSLPRTGMASDEEKLRKEMKGTKSSSIEGFDVVAADNALGITISRAIELNEVMESLTKTVAGFGKVVSSVFKNSDTGILAGQLGLQKMMLAAQSLEVKFVSLAKASLFYEQRNRKLQKSLGISVEVMSKFAGKMDQVNSAYEYGGLAARNYLEALNKLAPGIGALMGAQSDTTFVEELLDAQHIMTTLLDLSEEEANNYELYARGKETSGKKLIDQNAQLADYLKEAGYETGVLKTITQEVANLSNDIQLQYGRLPNNLELAVLKSRALGVTFSQIHDAGKGLLDIETSVGNELEYQLLSGRRLIGDQTASEELRGKSLTSEFRKAVMMRDAEKQARIMNQIMRQEGDEIEKNMFSREAMSKLLNMDEATMSRMRQKQKLHDTLVKYNIKEDVIKLTGDELGDKLAELTKLTPKEIEKLIKVQESTLSTEEEIVLKLEKINTTIIDTAAKSFGGAGQAMRSGRKGALDAVSLLGSVIEDMTGATDPATMGGIMKGWGLAAATISSATAIIGAMKATIEGSAEVDAQEVNIYTATGVTSLNDGMIAHGGSIAHINSADDIFVGKAGGPVQEAIYGGNGVSAQQIASAVKEAVGNMNVNINFDRVGLAKMVEAEISFDKSQRLT